MSLAPIGSLRVRVALFITHNLDTSSNREGVATRDTPHLPPLLGGRSNVTPRPENVTQRYTACSLYLLFVPTATSASLSQQDRRCVSPVGDSNTDWLLIPEARAIPVRPAPAPPRPSIAPIPGAPAGRVDARTRKPAGREESGVVEPGGLTEALRRPDGGPDGPGAAGPASDTDRNARWGVARRSAACTPRESPTSPFLILVARASARRGSPEEAAATWRP